MSDLTTPLPTHILLATRPIQRDTWEAICTCGHTSTAPTYGQACDGHVQHLHT